MDSKSRAPGTLFLIADGITLALEVLVYFSTLCGPALVLWQIRHSHPLLLLAALILGYVVASLLFVAVLVGVQRAVIGPVGTGRFLLTSPRCLRWMIADRFVKMMYRSPFRPLVMENGLLRYLYLRGMGASIDTSFLMGNLAKLPEPWAVRLGSNVVLGDNAVLSGHKVEGNVVTLDTIEIGDRVVIGAGSIVFPGTRIGAGATVGANSVVARGTVIPAGETWAGIPACRVGLAQPSQGVGAPAQKRPLPDYLTPVPQAMARSS